MSKVIPIKAIEDVELCVSFGKSKYDKKYKNLKMGWLQFLDTVKEKTVRTNEKFVDYLKLPKPKQDEIKDVGGFVGGHLREGRRSKSSVENRQILTLDLDFAPYNLWEELLGNMDLEYSMALYSTHKHCKDNPRYRLLIPLAYPVDAERYEAISRKIAEKINIEYFDDTTFQAERLMYWPSHSQDAEFIFTSCEGSILNPEEILSEYPDWTDTSYWPESSRVNKSIKKAIADKQQDPLTKKNLIGAFCRTYNIHEAIAEFLSEKYAPTAHEDRYTFTGGSTSAGLVVYDDVFAYSNHSTDPASQTLCNAFDLVRLHLFSDLDKNADGDTAVSKLPSFTKMSELAGADPKVIKTKDSELLAEAEADFAELEKDEDWKSRLKRNTKGDLVNSIRNTEIIMTYDEHLQGIAYNEVTKAIAVKSPLPWNHSGTYWTNQDDAQLFAYLTRTYGVQFTERCYQGALTVAADNRRFNPIKEFIEALPEWDGIPRLDTMLIDYLGADSSDYVKAVTRKTFVGAIARGLKPGIKFDTVLVLNGKPGIGKSTILARLGGEWFSDSLSLTDIRDKTGSEKLQGVWIMEIGEMQGQRKADLDALKGFITRVDDIYRPAYGRVVEHNPRITVLVGTTNNMDGFLRDTTGNRRWWPVKVYGGSPKTVWDMSEDERLQIWAEAYARYKEGEPLHLSPELEDQAREAQREALEYNEHEGEVRDYLSTLLPDDWYERDIYDRVNFFHDKSDFNKKNEKCSLVRTKVCIREIFCEGLGRAYSSYTAKDGKDIAAIMARIPGWERMDNSSRIKGYGTQRCYIKK